MKMAVFWIVAPCILVEVYQRFRGPCCLHHQGDESLMMTINLMMEAERTSETLVNFYQTTQRYNPEDSHLRTHRRENLNSYLIYRHDWARSARFEVVLWVVTPCGLLAGGYQRFGGTQLLHFHPEERDDTLLRNAGNHLQDCVATQPEIP
jgi:hypothetical protein